MTKAKAKPPVPAHSETVEAKWQLLVRAVIDAKAAAADAQKAVVKAERKRMLTARQVVRADGVVEVQVDADADAAYVAACLAYVAAQAAVDEAGQAMKTGVK